MKLAIIFSQKKFSGKLTWLFTGCYAYHVAWVDELGGKMYDMHLIRRCRKWPNKYSEYLLFDVPQVTAAYLEDRLDSDDSVYGVVDYLLFGLRPLFHLFGKSTRNAGGVICSEMVNNDMQACGVDTPWLPGDEPPSPCDLYRFLSKQG